MMNLQSFLLLVAVASSTWKLGGASGILARGNGESLPYPDVGGAIAGAAAVVLDSISWFLQGAPGLEIPPTDQNESPATEPGPETPPTGQNAGPATAPTFELNAETSQSTFLNCDPGSDFSAPFDSNNCQPPSPQLIFTKNCASHQNLEIEELLNTMQPIGGWYASMDDKCGPGARFYGANLRRDQIAKFEAMIENGAVRDIEADEELVDLSEENSMDTPSEWQQGSTDASFSGRLKKRGDISLQADAKRHLIFLSYPNQMSLAERNPIIWPGYRYFSRAGAGITVYVIENGANPANDEVVIERWLYSAKVARTQTEYVRTLLWKGHGSCGVSLINGPKYGVAKNAKVIMVKNTFVEGSVLAAFQEIINDIYRRNRGGEVTAGYTVVTMHGGFKKTISETKRQRLGEAIQTLFNEYKVVVVIAAGGYDADEEQGITEINTWPQLFSLDPLYSSMITVGAVSIKDGSKFSWSKGRPGANVWAPGEAYCAYGYAGDSAQVWTGTSVSAAIVAGLAAYFLSLLDVGAQLRQSENIPLAVLQHIQSLSQPRDPAYKSIWNGLNSLMPGPNDDYGWQP